MKKLYLSLALAAVFFIEPPAAFATPLVDDHTCQGSGNCNVNVDDHSNTANGGEGGDAAAAAVAISKGGDVYRSGNSDVDVKNRVDVDNNNRLSNKQGQQQRQSNSQSQTQSVDGSGNSNVAINNPRQPVSSAVAAALTSSPEACMGSTSIGGQGVGFGLSIGTTWEDEACQARMDAKTLQALGYGDAARARLCMVDAYRQAFAASGLACPTPPEE